MHEILDVIIALLIRNHVRKRKHDPRSSFFPPFLHDLLAFFKVGEFGEWPAGHGEGACAETLDLAFGFDVFEFGLLGSDLLGGKFGVLGGDGVGGGALEYG